MSWKVNSIKVTYELVDETTGEIITETRELGEGTVKKPRASRSKKNEDTDPTPKAILLDNKIQLNNAAVELTGFQADDKINVKYEKKGRITTPVMLLDEKEGNRLTKTNTISCRGSKREELLKFGDTFIVEEHPSVVGTFILKGNVEIEDDIVDIPEEIASDDEIDDSLDDINDDVNLDTFKFEF